MSASLEFVELRVTAFSGPLIILVRGREMIVLVRGREGILFTSFQVKIKKSQNSFVAPVGFTLTLDKIHGTTVNLQ